MDRDKIIKAFDDEKETLAWLADDEYTKGYNSGLERGKTIVLNLLKKQDSVEPHSHLTDDSDLYFTCGKCGHAIWSESYKYCPMCGLKIAWNGE